MSWRNWFNKIWHFNTIDSWWLMVFLWVSFRALEVCGKGTLCLIYLLWLWRLKVVFSKELWNAAIFQRQWWRGEVVKGKRCLTYCLQMILLLFRRLPKIKWFIYTDCSCGLKLVWGWKWTWEKWDDSQWYSGTSWGVGFSTKVERRQTSFYLSKVAFGCSI